MTKELWALGALDLAERIAAGEISSREVIGAHLARIEAVNPAVNAVTVALADEAMAAAATADQAIAAGHSLGPLHGVPFTVKENLDVEGGPTTAGGRLPGQRRPGRCGRGRPYARCRGHPCGPHQPA